MFDVVVEFPKMKVGVATREDRVVEIRYLPRSSPSIPPKNALAEKALIQLERYRENPDAVFSEHSTKECRSEERRVGKECWYRC